MILYFSGTGNSRFVAQELGNQLEDSVISINKCLQAKKYRRFMSEKPYVIVAPIYASRMPLEVEEYLKRSHFSGSHDIWFVFTCGGGMGGAANYCRKLAESMGLIYHGTGCVVMPNNYVVLSDVISSEEAEAKARTAIPAINEIALTISRSEELTADPALTKFQWSSSMAGFFHSVLIRDRAFKADEKCIGCRKCEKICPMDNICIKDGKPVWNGKCMHCMACISICPVRAINYGNKTQKRQRYYLY